jgi:hypothetical protein
MASSLSPNRSSPKLEELKKSIYDHEDYVSLLSIQSSKKKWLTKEKKAGFLKKLTDTIQLLRSLELGYSKERIKQQNGNTTASND